MGGGGDEPRAAPSVRGAGLPTWSVDVPPWSAEEGRSGVTLQLTIWAGAHGEFDVEVDDLHVL